MKPIKNRFLGLSLVVMLSATQGWGQQPSTPASPPKPTAPAAAPAAGKPANQPKPPESPIKALETKLKMAHEHIPGPSQNDKVIKNWLADMKKWRELKLSEIKYYGTEYDRPELKWCQSAFVQPQMMVEDRYFFDVETGKYTVDRYLDDLEKRYGGIDAVLVWAIYPNIGIDNSNQFDQFRAMPGGIPAMKQMVADFHRRGVKVMFGVMPC